MEGSRVELTKNILILGQFCFTLLYSTPSQCKQTLGVRKKSNINSRISTLAFVDRVLIKKDKLKSGLSHVAFLTSVIEKLLWIFFSYRNRLKENSLNLCRNFVYA